MGAVQSLLPNFQSVLLNQALLSGKDLERGRDLAAFGQFMVKQGGSGGSGANVQS